LAARRLPDQTDQLRERGRGAELAILSWMLGSKRRGRASQPFSAPRSTAAPSQPVAQRGARNLIFVVLDSLRYDSWIEGQPDTLAALGKVERRWSYASWTAPSHYNLLMGLLPHSSPREVYASEYYKQDFLRYSERLGVEGMEFASVLPSIFLPTYLKHSLGYSTHAMVSMPVLNRHTIINRDFDSYELMPKHNDMAAMVDQLTFDEERPSFWLLNVGETHYPYAFPGQAAADLPHGEVRIQKSQARGPDPLPGRTAARLLVRPGLRHLRQFISRSASRIRWRALPRPETPRFRSPRRSPHRRPDRRSPPG